MQGKHVEKCHLNWLELSFSVGFVLPAGEDALPTHSGVFWGQITGLSHSGKRYGSPGDLIFQPSTGPMSSLLFLLG